MIIQEQKKYENINLDVKKADLLYEKILKYMEEEKPFLNPDLTRKALADELKVNDYLTSWIINEKSQMNFSEFINTYRIKEAKRLLSESNETSIMQIGYKAGFNSQSNFNMVFKKHASMTPLQFRKQQLKDNKTKKQ